MRRPRVHGITSNRTLDPLRKDQEGWRWYTEDIAAPTLWSAVEAQGRSSREKRSRPPAAIRARHLRSPRHPGTASATTGPGPRSWRRFLAIGPQIGKRDLGTIHRVDIGPTIARWLGVTLPGATGHPIADL